MILLLQSLLLTWVVARLLKRSLPLAVVIGLLALLPLQNGVSLAMALHGLWGVPSITTLQLVALSLCRRTPSAISRGWRLPAAFALFGCVFYALVLGTGNFDPYRFGYQPAWLVAGLSVIAAFAWWRRQAFVVWILAIDLLAFAAGLHESSNLWDTLLDPLLILAMLVLAIRNVLRRHLVDTIGVV